MKSTTITITEETWNLLKNRKTLGQTFDDIIKEALLEIPEVKEVKNETN